MEQRKDRLAKTNFWEDLFALRDRQRADRSRGLQVIKERDLPLEVNRQGLMRWYLHPSIQDTVLSTLMFYQQEIPPGSRSGRLKTQGGQVLMILEGHGHTTINGVRHTWTTGDVLNLPLRADGLIIQHFNDDPNIAVKFISAEPNWFACTSVDRGCGFEQLEDSPDFQRDGRRG